jgi:hypothetical protein
MINRLGDYMKNKWLRWGLVFLWCSMIYYFTESPVFTGEHTASIIRDMVQKLQLKHVNNINDGFLSWNYIVRKLAHLSVFGMLAFLAWKAMYPRRFAWHGALRFYAQFLMNGTNRFNRDGQLLCLMSSLMHVERLLLYYSFEFICG